MCDDDWFEADDDLNHDGRNEDERRFIITLRARAQSWGELDIDVTDTQVWTDRDYIYVHVGISDQEQNIEYGTMRVNYIGQRVLGHWGSSHFCDEIDPTALDAFSSPLLDSPEDAANYAADWLESQLRRPAERREWWQGDTVVCRRWLLTKPEHALCAQYCHPSRVAGLPGVVERIERIIPLRADRRR